MNAEQLSAAISRTHQQLADARSDDQRQRLYFHLDKLLDAEVIMAGLSPEESAQEDLDEVIDLENAPQGDDGEEEETDEDKIAQAIAAGQVQVAPKKKARKSYSMSAEARHAKSEHFRRMQAARAGRGFTPIAFEDSKFAVADYVTNKNAANQAAYDNPAEPAEPAHDNSAFHIPVPEEIDQEDGEPIQIGGVELRP